MKNVELYQFIYFLLTCLLVVSLPFQAEHIQISSIIAILLVLNRIIFWNIPFHIAPAIKLLFIAYVAYYFLYALGLLYSHNQMQALALSERYLSFIFFPLVVFTSPALSQLQFRYLLGAFVVSCCISLLIGLGYATYQFVFYQQMHYFFYHPLANTVGLHGTYLAIYMCWAVFIAWYYWYSTQNRGWLVALVFTFIGLYLLSSRAQQVAALLAIFLIGVKYSYVYKKWIILGVSLVISLLASVLFWFNPGAKDRNQSDTALQENSYIYSSAYFRENRWRAAVQVIQHHLWIGTGSGDVQQDMDSICIQNQTAQAHIQGSNAHNQFLQTWAGTGMVGLALLGLILYQSLQIALASKSELYLIFLCIFVVSCLTEVVLETQKGVIWFSFFNSLLALYYHKHHSD